MANATEGAETSSQLCQNAKNLFLDEKEMKKFFLRPFPSLWKKVHKKSFRPANYGRAEAFPAKCIQLFYRSFLNSYKSLSKIVLRHNLFPAGGHIIEIFVQTNAQEGTGHIVNIVIAELLQGDNDIVASLSGAAVDVHRPIFRNFIQTLPEFAERNIFRVN